MEDKSLCFDEKLANFRGKYTSYFTFQHPTVQSQKFNTFTSRVVGTPSSSTSPSLLSTSSIHPWCYLWIMVYMFSKCTHHCSHNEDEVYYVLNYYLAKFIKQHENQQSLIITLVCSLLYDKNTFMNMRFSD